MRIVKYVPTSWILPTCFPLLHFLFPLHQHLHNTMYTYNLKTDNTPVCHSCTVLFQFLVNRAFGIIAAFTVYGIFLWLVIADSVGTLGAEDLSIARRSKCLYYWQILRELR
jgi:hypothetical protein